LILAIDTTAGTSAAVVSEGVVLGFSGFDDPYGHAENVGQAIGLALERAGITGEQIQRVAISRGPASYTGLRVGMAAGVAFATARQIPLHGVISLDAVAGFYAETIKDQRWLVTSDAKRGEMFVGLYEGIDQQVMKPLEVEDYYQGITRIEHLCDAKAVGIFAEKSIAQGIELTDVSALYLRSPDVSPSAGKRVSG
jgi:tRNA threonylcarbamoyl adenosine modification protein YeaZ